MTKYTPKHLAHSPRRVTPARAAAGLTFGAAAFTGTMGTAHAETGSTGGGIPQTLINIRHCESGGDYTAQNPTSSASGAYQFLDSTWREYPGSAGYARMKNAPQSVQDAAGLWLYQKYGTSPWVSSQGCWGRMSGTSSDTLVNTNGTSSTSGGYTGYSKSTTGYTNSGYTTSTGYSNTAYLPSSLRAALRLVPATYTPTTRLWDTNLTAGFPDGQFPYANVKLNQVEQQAVDNATAAQKNSEWWTADAAKGNIVTRHVATGNDASGVAHTSPNFTSATPSRVMDGEVVTGRYVNTDWFQVTSGAHKGTYISSALLYRAHKPVNGELNDTQKAVIPAALMSNGRPGSANPAAVKAIAQLHAAFRAQFGYGFTINEGYRDRAEEEYLYKTLPKGIAAEPGTSDHGLGLAFDLGGANFKPNSDVSAWMNGYSRFFGIQRPASFAKRYDAEYWHFNVIG